MSGICKLLYYNKGTKIKEYLLHVKKMSYLNSSSVILLELDNISSVDEEYVAYSKTEHGFGNVYPRIYFSSNEKTNYKKKIVYDYYNRRNTVYLKLFVICVLFKGDDYYGVAEPLVALQHRNIQQV